MLKPLVGAGVFVFLLDLIPPSSASGHSRFRSPHQASPAKAAPLDPRLVATIKQNDIPLAHTLIRGVNLEAHDRFGMTALLRAAQAGRPEIVKDLLAAGAHVNASNGDSATPLNYAVRKGSMETIMLLLQGRADVNLGDRNTGPPLMDACRAGNLEAARVLIEHGAHVNVKAPFGDGNTPLIIAAGKGATDLVSYLVEHGAKVNAANVGGGTPLHAAARAGAKDLVAYLLDHGAQANAVDLEGRTPLDEALAFQTPYVPSERLRRGFVPGRPPTPAEVEQARADRELRAQDEAEHQETDKRRVGEIAEILRRHGGKIGPGEPKDGG